MKLTDLQIIIFGLHKTHTHRFSGYCDQNKKTTKMQHDMTQKMMKNISISL